MIVAAKPLVLTRLHQMRAERADLLARLARCVARRDTRGQQDVERRLRDITTLILREEARR